MFNDTDLTQAGLMAAQRSAALVFIYSSSSETVDRYVFEYIRDIAQADVATTARASVPGEVETISFWPWRRRTTTLS